MTDNGTTALTERPKSKEGLAQLEQVVIRGDLSVLSEAERIGYYARVCDSLGINPLTRPFEYLTLNNKMVLYARKDATDQLRAINGISIDRLEHERDETLGLAIVTAYGHDRRKRTDSAMGAVSIKGLGGEGLANALMKAETKAKRRMTLSLAGLGWLDESEVGSIDESAGASHPIVETRREAVAQRLAGMTETTGPTARPAAEPAIDVDQIPFDPAAQRQGDPWMRMIHAVGAERGLDHDAIHQLAADKLGVDSLNDLSIFQRAGLEEILRTTEAEATAADAAKPTRRKRATEQPGQGADQEVTPPAVDAAPAPAPTPELSLEEATKAVADAAVAAGLSHEWDGPAGLNQLARDALSLDPDTMTAGNWLTLRDKIAAGELAPTEAVS